MNFMEKVIKSARDKIKLFKKLDNTLEIRLKCDAFAKLGTVADIDYETYPVESVEWAFFKNVNNNIKYSRHDLDDWRTWLRINLNFWADMGYWAFAASNSSVFLSPAANAERDFACDFEKASKLFADYLNVDLSYSVPSVKTVEDILLARVDRANEYYVKEHGDWILNFKSQLDDDISRESFTSFIRQRINSLIFINNEVKHPMTPPNITRQWRQDRYMYRGPMPYIEEPNGKLVCYDNYIYIYIYQKYHIENQVCAMPGDTVIDAGAYVGDSSLWLSRRVGPEGKVYAFDINPSYVEKGRDNIAWHDVGNVEYFDCGLGDNNTLDEIRSDKHSCLLPDMEKGSLEIKICAIDELRQKLGKIDFIKVDAGDFGLALVRGAAETIKRDKPSLAIAVNNNMDDFWQVPQFITGLSPEYEFWFRMEAEPVIFARAKSRASHMRPLEDKNWEYGYANLSKTVRKHNSLDVPINVYLTDHCNLNCKGCTTYAPLAEKKFLDLNGYENDIRRLAELSDKKIARINIMGGEPLLHPQCAKFIEITRKYLNNSSLGLLTNGLLLANMGDDFFQTLKKNNVFVVITKYPININHKWIEDKLKSYSIPLYYHNTNMYWYEIKISLKPRPPEEGSRIFFNCYQNGRDCHSLVDGVYYPCSFGSRIDVLQKALGHRLPDMVNGIDIHKVDSLEDILDFISKPISLCVHCGVCSVKKTNWEHSKRELSEWIE